MESYNDNQNSDSESVSNQSSSSKSYNTSDIQNEDSMPTYDNQEVAEYTGCILDLIENSTSENAEQLQQIRNNNNDDFTSHIKNLITKRILNKTDRGDESSDIIFSIKKLTTGLNEEDLSKEDYQNDILEYLCEYFSTVVNINPENNLNDNEEEKKGGNLPLNTTQVNHPVSQLPENPISSTLQITQSLQSSDANQDVPQDRLAGLKREKEESQSSDDDLNSKKDANKRLKKNNDNNKGI